MFHIREVIDERLLRVQLTEDDENIVLVKMLGPSVEPLIGSIRIKDCGYVQHRNIAHMDVVH